MSKSATPKESVRDGKPVIDGATRWQSCRRPAVAVRLARYPHPAGVSRPQVFHRGVARRAGCPSHSLGSSQFAFNRRLPRVRIGDQPLRSIPCGANPTGQRQRLFQSEHRVSCFACHAARLRGFRLVLRDSIRNGQHNITQKQTEPDEKVPEVKGRRIYDEAVLAYARLVPTRQPTCEQGIWGAEAIFAGGGSQG